MKYSFGLLVLRGVARVRRTLRNWFSRREWSIRLLRLEKSEETGDQPGLILIQIDGLSRAQLEQAFARKRMPFLKTLLEREGYELKDHYSGVPSTTAAVQAEIFYGVKCGVPAFGFREQATGKLIRMIEGEPAQRREQALSQQGEGLLAGGSSYSNMYSGGAQEVHFCPSVMGWGNFLKNSSRPRSLLVFLWNAMSFFRVGIQFCQEVVLSFVDVYRGVVAGRSLLHELKFVPHRVAVGTLLREFIAIGAEIDATRGLPIIHVNFLGYDEQSHRRGPDSLFAHQSLKHIDRSIQRICDAAFRSPRRDYQVWIYSDHGQEKTTPYSQITGRPLPDVIRELYRNGQQNQQPSTREEHEGVEHHRASLLGGKFFQKLLPPMGLTETEETEETEDSEKSQAPQVADQGPLAHIYWPEELSDQAQGKLAEQLVKDHRIPLVFAVEEAGTVLAWTPEGKFTLPRDTARVFGEDHPFLAALAEDWVRLCQHPEAGDLVICGWNRHGTSVSFVTENGAHAGPGPGESGAFALLPSEAPLEGADRDFLRPAELRSAALRVLRRESSDPPEESPRIPTEPSRRSLRILTYNVHSCIGLDRKHSPRRIARVIAQAKPDIIALQELDVGRLRTGGEDQAHSIARELAMEFHFHAALQVEEEQYGNAILSRFPLRLIKEGMLPTSPQHEPRGALWVTIDVDGTEIQILNTHLSLLHSERQTQLDALLGPEWLGDSRCTDPVILCGDFNTSPSSPLYRQITRHLHDSQAKADTRKTLKTWSSTFPIRCLDYVFFRGPFSVAALEVPRTRLVRVASDHRPLIVELTLEPAPHSQTPPAHPTQVKESLTSNP